MNEAAASPGGGPPTTASRQAMDDLRSAIAEVVRPSPVSITAPSSSNEPSEDSPVTLTPLALRRVGRSHRSGPLLDLRLAVAVDLAGPDALDSLERVLVWAETTGTVVEEPEPGRGRGLGLVLLVPVSVPLGEPTAPLVTTRVVRLLPSGALEGSVLTAGGTAARDVTVSSSLTRQVVRTDTAGRFRLVGAPVPTTVTARDGRLSASVDVSDGTGPIVIHLPATPEEA